MSDYSSIVPVGSRKTSVFGSRWGTTHAGTDYAPPKPGQKDVPIYAVRAGTVSRVGMGNGAQNAKVLPYHSGNGVLINHGVINGDNVETYYGHLDSYSVKEGQKVSKGQIIGIMGNTGNSTAIHLHFGVRLNKRTMIDPDRWIRSKGITPGTTKPYVKPIVVLPTPNTSINVTPTMSAKQANINIQNALKRMGLYSGKVDGINGSMQKNAVKAYQRSQKIYKLVEDGNWGAATKAHYIWTRKLQTELNKPIWRGKLSPLVVDGNLGNATVERIKYVQRTFRRAYKGAVDGIPGAMFCAAIKIPKHP